MEAVTRRSKCLLWFILVFWGISVFEGQAILVLFGSIYQCNLLLLDMLYFEYVIFGKYHWIIFSLNMRLKPFQPNVVSFEQVPSKIDPSYHI